MSKQTIKKEMNMKKQLLALALTIGMLTTVSVSARWRDRYTDDDAWRSAYWQDQDARWQSSDDEGGVTQAALLAPRAAGNFVDDLSEGKGVVQSSANVVRNTTGDAVESIDKTLNLNWF
jgi:type II secretory pathway component PulK